MGVGKILRSVQRSRFRSNRIAAALVGLSLWLGATQSSFAIPVLQLYIEGATYDQSTETWVLSNSANSSNTFRIWAIGNVSGPGGQGTIYDVKLAASYDKSIFDAGDINIELKGSTINPADFPTVPPDPETSWDKKDPSNPGDVSSTGTNVGTTPLLGDGSPLPNHGEYGPDRVWQEFQLGDFNKTDSAMADFINGFPTTWYNNKGQINVYDVIVTTDSDALDGTNFNIHFDLYDHYCSKTKAKYVFAPFSHDAEGGGTTDGGGGTNVVPEPLSVTMWSLGFAGLVGIRRRMKKAQVA